MTILKTKCKECGNTEASRKDNRIVCSKCGCEIWVLVKEEPKELAETKSEDNNLL